MDEVFDLGSNRGFNQPRVAFNSYQGIISDDEDSEFKEWPQKTELNNNDSLVTLVSSASEMSIYNRSPKNSAQRNHSAVSCSGYLSALDLRVPDVKIPSPLPQRKPQMKPDFLKRVKSHDLRFQQGKKLNFLQAVKGGTYERDLGTSAALENRSQLQETTTMPASENVRFQGGTAADAEMRSDEDVVKFPVSESKRSSIRSVLSEMSSVCNKDLQDGHSFSNNASHERPSLSFRASQERPSLSSRSSREKSPISNSAYDENSKSATKLGCSIPKMEKSSIENPVRNKLSVKLPEPYYLSTAISGSGTMHQHNDDMMTISPPSPTFFSSPSQNGCFSDRSHEITPESSCYQSEWLHKTGIYHHLLSGQEVEDLIRENIILKKEIRLMSERQQRHLIIEKNLQKENLSLVRELARLKRGWKRDQAGRMEIATPCSPMEGVRQNRSHLETLQKAYHREPFPIASQSQLISIPKSIKLKTPEMNTTQVKKVDSRNASRISGLDDTSSPMELISTSKDKSKEGNAETEILIKPKVKKKDRKTKKTIMVKKSSSNKRDNSPINTINHLACSKSSANTGTPKTNKRKDRKKDKEKKGIKSPVFDFTNLIINYLPPEMDSSVLQQLFSSWGEILTCKVVMDHKTGLSKGYGFVKFKTKEQATLATEKMDQYKIGGKTLKVACARKTERGKQENKQTNLYIANLDKNVETSDIWRVFSKCGYVVQCRVLKDVRGVTRRIGFVRFDSNESALRAIKQYDGKKMEGTKSVIQVRFANVPKAPPSSAETPPIQVSSPARDTTQFISQLISQGDSLHSPIPFESNSQNEFFGSNTRDVVVPSSAEQHFPIPHEEGFEKSRGNDESTSDYPAQETSSSATCYVSGINARTEEAELVRKFDPEGLSRIKSVRIIRRRAGPYAFVNFFHIEDAIKAVKTLNQTQMGSYTLTVRLK